MPTKKKAPKKSPAKSPAKKPAAKRSAAKPAANGATLNPKKAYEDLEKAANALPAASVKVTNLSAPLARANTEAASKALAPYLGKLGKGGAVDAKKVAAIGTIARAFEYAVSAVPNVKSDHTIEGALARLAPVRAATLAYLDAAVFCGIVDAGRVRAIHMGHGSLDIAYDAVAIAGIFDDDEAALAGKHPFTDTQLDTLRDEGAWLSEHLKPGGAMKDPKSRAPQALMRDRIAALLEDAYAEAEKAAAQIWGFASVRAHVPSLYAHASAPKKRAPKAVPTPPPSTMPASS